ncbi:hypothetical protein Tco_0218241 [Tanacetum coccineum]
MEPLMIEGKTLKDREDHLGTITKDKNAGIGSPHTEDLTMDCSLTCPKAQERSSPQKRSWARHKSMSGIKKSDRRGSKIRALGSLGKRSRKEIKGKRIKNGAKTRIIGLNLVKFNYYSKLRRSREKSRSMPLKRARKNESSGALEFYWAGPWDELYVAMWQGFYKNFNLQIVFTFKAAYESNGRSYSIAAYKGSQNEGHVES